MVTSTDPDREDAPRLRPLFARNCKALRVIPKLPAVSNGVDLLPCG